MRHAYGGQEDKPIVIELKLYENKIVIAFSDWGKEFNPSEISPPVFDGTREGGYGWFIINHYTDETHYCHNGDGKNTLTVVTEIFNTFFLQPLQLIYQKRHYCLKHAEMAFLVLRDSNNFSAPL